MENFLVSKNNISHWMKDSEDYYDTDKRFMALHHL